jgi:hypothetical protein
MSASQSISIANPSRTTGWSSTTRILVLTVSVRYVFLFVHTVSRDLLSIKRIEKPVNNGIQSQIKVIPALGKLLSNRKYLFHAYRRHEAAV